MPFLPVLAAATVTIAALAAPPTPSSDVRSTRVRLSTGRRAATSSNAARPTASRCCSCTATPTPGSRSAPCSIASRRPIRAIVPTQRGHGDSDRPECCYRLADFAADAVALLDALGVPRATVVGHSMGSFVAQRVAIDAPGRVSRLVLIGSGTTVRTPPVLEFHQSVSKLTDPVSRRSCATSSTAQSRGRFPPSSWSASFSESAKLPARVWRDVLAGLVAADAVNSSRTHQ